MAILTLAQALQAARIVASTDNIPASITATATPLYEGAVDAINRYASGAPDNAKNLALERLFGYLWEEDRVGGRRSRYPLVDSGAASILTPYRSRRAGVITPFTPRSTSQPSSQPSGNGQGMPGPQGPIGPAGPQGATGATGPQGPAGHGVPVGGTDGQVLTKSSSTDYDTAWEDAAAGQGGGLTQSQVDGRINTLIPVNRRVPSYAVGDANEVLKVAADGNSLTFAPESGGSGAGTGGILSDVSWIFPKTNQTVITGSSRSKFDSGLRVEEEADYIVFSYYHSRTVTHDESLSVWWSADEFRRLRSPASLTSIFIDGLAASGDSQEIPIHNGTRGGFSTAIPTSSGRNLPQVNIVVFRNATALYHYLDLGGTPARDTSGRDHYIRFRTVKLGAGPTGPRGPAGPTGPAGPKGDRGTAGVGTGGTGVPTGGTAGQVLGKKSDTNYDTEWQDASGETLTRRTALPAIAGFNNGDLISLSGELYELVANTEDSNVYRGTIAANAAGDTGYFGDMTFRFQAVSPFNMRANFAKAGLPTAPANLYVKYHSGTDYADIVLTRSSGSDTSTTWGYVHSPGTPGLEAPTAGDDFDLTVFSDTAYTTAQSIHAASRWEPYDRNDPDLNPIALANNNDRWPKAKLPSDTVYGTNASTYLLKRTPGLTLTSTTADFNVGNAPYYWSNPGIDLDDHSNGEFRCSLELTILPTSDVNMGFVQGKANQLGADRQVALSNIIFASDLAELSDYVVGTNPQTLNGLNVFRQTVYSGATIVGHYNIIMVHDSNNNVGYHVFWDGQAGATGATFNAELRVTFTSSDATAATAGGAGFTSFLTGTTPITISRSFTAAATNITIPTDKTLLFVRFELSSPIWRGFAIASIADLLALTAVTDGSTVSGNDILSLYATSRTSDRLIYASRTSSNELLVSTNANTLTMTNIKAIAL